MKQDMLFVSAESNSGASPGSGRRIPSGSGVPTPFSVFACVVAMAVCGGFGVNRIHAHWTTDDAAYAGYLVNQLRYFDTAERWLAEVVGKRTLTEPERAEVASWKINILQAQGKTKEAHAALEAFKKRYPFHVRAALSDLEVIRSRFNECARLLDRAVVDLKQAASLRKKATTIFTSEVDKGLAGAAKNLDASLAKAKPNSKEARVLMRSRDQSELERIKFHLAYAQKLPPDFPGRRDVLNRGYELASQFVEERYEYPVMQYEAQLQKGVIAYELERYPLAEENLEILYTIEPPFAPPFSPGLIKAFKIFRLQSLLFGARTAIATGDFAAAAVMLERRVFAKQPGLFDLSTAGSDADLKNSFILARLEFAVALCGAGRVEEGLDTIQRIIETYQKDETPSGQAFVNDARRAYGRVALIKGVELRGQDYYQAALGLKSELRFEDAVETFSTALSSLYGLKDVRKFAPLCLNEIGELHFVIGRRREQEGDKVAAGSHFLRSAVAYQEICNYFSTNKLISKAAKNFLSAATRASRFVPGGSDHSGLKALQDAARKVFDLYGGDGITRMQDILRQAQEAEINGEYAKARKLYAQITPTFEGNTVPFYHRAQASVPRSWLLEWHREEDEDKKKELEPELAKAVSALEAIVPKALEAGEKLGAATAAITLGQIHYFKDDWKQVAAALEVFMTELKSEERYRCDAWAYLTMAHSRLGDCKAGFRSFKLLYGEAGCKSSPLVASAAQELSDCAIDSGDDRLAASLIYIYYMHPSTRQSGVLDQPEVLLMVVSRLTSAGGKKNTNRADKIVKKLKKIIKKNPEGQRQLLLLDTKILVSRADWKKVIETLEEYIAKHEPIKGRHAEDPQVFYDVAEAYMKVDGQGGKRNGKKRRRLSTKNAIAAEKNYGSAVFLLNRYRKKDPRLERKYWSWVYKWLRLKMLIGDAGQKDAYADIILFLQNFKGQEMGGREASLMRLLKKAQEKNK